MPRVSKTRLYGRVERKLWRNTVFRKSLSDDARLLWLYLLSTFREARLPGLVEATVLSIMEDLDWNNRCGAVDELDGIFKGLKKTTSALDELESLGWVVYSKSDRLLLVTNAVRHNLPQNEDIVTKWVKTLAEFPDSSTKRSWLKFACVAMQSSFGNADGRYKRLKQYLNSTVQTPLCKKDDETKEEIDLGSTRCPPDDSNSVPESENNGTHHACTTNTNTSTSINTNTITNTKQEKERSHNVPTSATQAPQKSKPIKQKKAIEKPKNPPEDFTNRQKDFFRALQETKFYIRGEGGKTAFDAVKDPVQLARNLGDIDSFPLVDVGLLFYKSIRVLACL